MASVFTLGFSILIDGPSHLPWLNRIMLARIGNPRILFIMIIVISVAGIVLGLGARQLRRSRTERQALK
jgi:hypothetical protein